MSPCVPVTGERNWAAGENMFEGFRSVFKALLESSLFSVDPPHVSSYKVARLLQLFVALQSSPLTFRK